MTQRPTTRRRSPRITRRSSSSSCASGVLSTEAQAQSATVTLPAMTAAATTTTGSQDTIRQYADTIRNYPSQLFVATTTTTTVPQFTPTTIVPITTQLISPTSTISASQYMPPIVPLTMSTTITTSPIPTAGTTVTLTTTTVTVTSCSGSIVSSRPSVLPSQPPPVPIEPRVMEKEMMNRAIGQPSLSQSTDSSSDEDYSDHLTTYERMIHAKMNSQFNRKAKRHVFRETCSDDENTLSVNRSFGPMSPENDPLELSESFEISNRQNRACSTSSNDINLSKRPIHSRKNIACLLENFDQRQTDDAEQNDDLSDDQSGHNNDDNNDEVLRDNNHNLV
ncbi:hypothetical protein HCN44_005004 [Aphidius gifuensis]|uniref:Uncharacterized protein n=1 Tax=Aphidius gifuensis TaxID=684658 RepID=A0A835CTT9_APHGI|nr:hypothetical protein HCN44_005004 [Aphidius gifuensis]